MISELVLNALRKTQNNGASETRANCKNDIFQGGKKAAAKDAFPDILFHACWPPHSVMFLIRRQTQLNSRVKTKAYKRIMKEAALEVPKSDSKNALR